MSASSLSKFMTAKQEVFIASVLLYVVAPLAPLLVSLMTCKPIYTEVVLTAALYPASIFVSSKSVLLFSFGLFSVLLFSSCLTQPAGNPNICFAAWFAIVSVMVFHGIERYRMHVVEGEKLFNFTN